MSKSQVVRGSLAQKVIKKYETTEEVPKEFLENDDFVTRYSTTIPEEEFENGLESIEDDLEGGNDHQAYKRLKKLGIKEFGKRAEKAIEKIKANTDSINIADLKIFEHLSGHRKIAGDLIRELRDGTFVEDGEFLYGITHCVIYEKPRKYYHMVVKINKSTDMIIEYTNPFYFLSNAIEYCIGLEKRGSTYYVFVSQNDKNLVFLEFEESSLVWRKL
jgi:hypothetical protein